MSSVPTAYALACGAIARCEDLPSGNSVTLWHEHTVYHVRYINWQRGIRDWRTFHTRRLAVRCYHQLRRRMARDTP